MKESVDVCWGGGGGGGTGPGFQGEDEIAFWNHNKSSLNIRIIENAMVTCIQKHLSIHTDKTMQLEQKIIKNEFLVR